MQIWVSEVKLSAEGQADISISAHAWVNTLNSPRVFFKGKGYLPNQTPAGLTHLREKELDDIKARFCPTRLSAVHNPGFVVQNYRAEGAASLVLLARCAVFWTNRICTPWQRKVRVQGRHAERTICVNGDLNAPQCVV